MDTTLKEKVEIGGFFQLEEYKGKALYSDLIALNTARNALIYIIRAKRIEKIHIPTYICSAVVNVLVRENIQYSFYEVGADFLPIYNTAMDENEAIYIINYYGLFDNFQIGQLAKKFGKIILDNAHAFFLEPIKGIDTIYSCRKFFGVSDGAYLSTDIVMNNELDTDISCERMLHILGRYEKNAQDYYKEFRQVEDGFDELPLMYMSKLTQNMMRGIDYCKCKDKRTKTFMLYNERLREINLFEIRNIDGAYAYPLYIENAQQLRKIMIREKIFIPMLWSDVNTAGSEDDMALEYSNNILPLPCDQRMREEDVERVINVILENVIKTTK